MDSWVDSEGTGFGLENLPFGIFEKDNILRAGVRIGNHVLDLARLCQLGFLEYDAEIFRNVYLNDFLSLGKDETRNARLKITELLGEGSELRNSKHKNEFLHPVESVAMRMPVKPWNYIDFYSSLEHATNVGKLFRPDNPLYPNWKEMPVAYNGRASSIVISGTDIHRPVGQIRQGEFGASEKLDFELEMAFITYDGAPGEITTASAHEHIFGLVLLNDWSARDIQKWEYVPLGPFLSKNFATSISPWIVPLDALEPFRTEGPSQSPVLPYLMDNRVTYDLKLEVYLQPQDSPAELITRSNFKHLYWTMAQQLAHLATVCDIHVGDIIGSGTISSPYGYGSMLELTIEKPISLKDGSERRYLDDGDAVIMRAYADDGNVRISFGEVMGKILPAN